MNGDIPKHFTNSKATSLRNFSDVKRAIHRIEPYNAQTFNSTTQRRILTKLPRVGLLRGTRSYMRCDVVVAGGSINSVYEIFNRHRVKVGNQVVIDEREYGFYKITQLKASVKTGDSNSASLKATGDANAATDSVKLELKLPLASVLYDKRNLFSELLPLYKMDQFEIEFQVNDSIDQFTKNGATGITIDNIQFILDIVDSPRLRGQFSSEVKRAVESQDHQFRNLAAGSSKINELLPSAYQNIQHIICIQRDNADVSVGVTGNEYFDHILKTNSADNIQILLDGKTYPEQPYKSGNGASDGIGGVELIHALEECWYPKDEVLGSFHNYANWENSNRAYIGVPLATLRKAVSGIRSSNTSGNVQFKCDINNTNQTNLDFFITYHKFISISPSGSLKMAE